MLNKKKLQGSPRLIVTVIYSMNITFSVLNLMQDLKFAQYLIKIYFTQ